MPIRKRGAPKPAGKKTYVYVGTNAELIVRTPAACTKWDQKFRERIVRDYVPPRTLRSLAEHERLTHADNNPDRIYNVGGKRIRVVHPAENIDQPGYTVILRTDIQNLTDGTSLFLCHSDPAMRMLMVYSFITGERYEDVPDLQIAAIDQ